MLHRDPQAALNLPALCQQTLNELVSINNSTKEKLYHYSHTHLNKPEMIGHVACMTSLIVLVAANVTSAFNTGSTFFNNDNNAARFNATSAHFFKRFFNTPKNSHGNKTNCEDIWSLNNYTNSEVCAEKRFIIDVANCTNNSNSTDLKMKCEVLAEMCIEAIKYACQPINYKLLQVCLFAALACVLLIELTLISLMADKIKQFKFGYLLSDTQERLAPALEALNIENPKTLTLVEIITLINAKNLALNLSKEPSEQTESTRLLEDQRRSPNSGMS